MVLTVKFDGACNNNSVTPYMGIGFVAWEGDNIVHRYNRPSGLGSSNIAEWLALGKALNYCYSRLKSSKILKINDIQIFGDSQLVVNQFSGVFRTKMSELNRLRGHCLNTQLNICKLCESTGVHYSGVFWIPREENVEADVESKLGLNYYYD